MPERQPDPGTRLPQGLPTSARDLVSRAIRDVERREGDPTMPFATASKPWCAAWCSTVLRACGVDVPVMWGAMDLLAALGDKGFSIPHDGPLQYGDIVAWPRKDSSGAVVGGHVSIVLKDSPAGLVVIAGNSAATADRVAISVVKRDRVTNAARPLK